MKTLIVFCTRYGATASTSEEIANILRDEGFDVRVVNTKKEKIQTISNYELVLIGSGMKLMRWCGEAEKFLKKFQDELRQKKTAIFVSSGTRVIYKHEGDTETLEKEWKKNLEDKVEKYSLNPIALATFGGILDYNQMGFFARKTMNLLVEKIEAAGVQEEKPGIYDTRDWDEIRTWVKDLIEKVK
ncbi:MAG: flavodoxin domain-containing protein [Candidatus Thorarchaeota archaeon]|jgi:menaquinone-dependent protoporphyrinogen oxidase